MLLPPSPVPGYHFSILCLSISLFKCFLKLKILFAHLRERGRESAQAGGGAEGEGEAGILLSRDPDLGLDPRTLGS